MEKASELIMKFDSRKYYCKKKYERYHQFYPLFMEIR